MKLTLLVLHSLGTIELLATSCAKNEAAPTADCTRLATVIGRHPCDPHGYILALEAPHDTVNCFNVPAGLVSEGTNSAYGNLGYVLFDPSEFVQLKIGYTTLATADQTVIICKANIWLEPWLAMTKGREIKINCATKLEP